MRIPFPKRKLPKFLDWMKIQAEEEERISKQRTLRQALDHILLAAEFHKTDEAVRKAAFRMMYLTSHLNNHALGMITQSKRSLKLARLIYKEMGYGKRKKSRKQPPDVQKSGGGLVPDVESVPPSEDRTVQFPRAAWSRKAPATGGHPPGRGLPAKGVRGHNR